MPGRLIQDQPGPGGQRDEATPEGRTYPKDWQRCRGCGVLVALGTDHDRQSLTSTGKEIQPEPDGDDDAEWEPPADRAVARCPAGGFRVRGRRDARSPEGVSIETLTLSGFPTSWNSKPRRVWSPRRYPRWPLGLFRSGAGLPPIRQPHHRIHLLFTTSSRAPKISRTDRAFHEPVQVRMRCAWEAVELCGECRDGDPDATAATCRGVGSRRCREEPIQGWAVEVRLPGAMSTSSRCGAGQTPAVRLSFRPA